MYINKAMLFGNLTRDPELRALPSGGSVTSFSIATNRSFKKADGTRAEETQFHNVVVFGKQAESCAQYLKKGSSAYVEGRMQTRSWDGEHGKQYRTELVAETVQFGPRPPTANPVTGGQQEDPDAHDGVDYPAEDEGELAVF